MATETDRGHQPEQIDRRRLVLGVGWTLLILVLCLFLPAGTWAWSRGWQFFSFIVAASILITFYLRRVNPDVIAARVNRHEGTKRWDRILTAVVLRVMMAIPIVAGLDFRFQWSRAPGWVCVLGYALLLVGTVGLTWAESVNRFFEPTVRIQADRGHKVIDTGPYAIVRHPGYVASFFWLAGIALCLGSYWALLPAGLASLLLVLRTQWEDQTLQAELPGYKEYTQRVRYRLIPGLW